MFGRKNDKAMRATMRRLIKKEVNEIAEKERKRIIIETTEDNRDQQKNGSGTQFRAQVLFEMTKAFGQKGENKVFNNSFLKATNLLSYIRELWKKKNSE
ncbi:hypothetical protein SLEP1_g12405 [Rubroshorea leprosula]|uniref:Uncharacterized protein n=1 Tax=Rubroshorea leprosula TaxID=152421 RepID=A0AAV5II90_9ROSI|nr:hypothetical protein SLEP1_g12405 [Rubroshorea leprosula]